jgi:hypothetical protein
VRCPPRGAAPRVPLESFFDPMTSPNALGCDVRWNSPLVQLAQPRRTLLPRAHRQEPQARRIPSVPHHIASIETYLHLNNEHPKPLIWTATAESILTTVQRGRVSPQQVDSQL